MTEPASELVDDIKAAMEWAFCVGAKAVHENYTEDAYPEFGEAASDTVRESDALEGLAIRIQSIITRELEVAVRAGWFAGVEAATKVTERRAEERFAEYGTTEPGTNASYYSGRGGEMYEALDEEDEATTLAIRSLATQPVEWVAILAAMKGTTL